MQHLESGSWLGYVAVGRLRVLLLFQTQDLAALPLAGLRCICYVDTTSMDMNMHMSYI
jgi:hypothetical protein